MVSQPVWIGIVIGVFFVGIGVSYAIFASTYDPNTMKFQNQELFDQMISQNSKMTSQWMESTMHDPQFMQDMMQNPEFKRQIMNQMMQDQEFMQDMLQTPQQMQQMIQDTSNYNTNPYRLTNHALYPFYLHLIQ